MKPSTARHLYCQDEKSAEIEGDRVKIASPTYGWEKIWDQGTPQPRPTQSICKRRPAENSVAWRPDFYCVLGRRLLGGFL